MVRSWTGCRDPCGEVLQVPDRVWKDWKVLDLSSLKNLNLSEIDNVRIGKHISLEIEADSKETASDKVKEACKNLLANHLMESYEFSLEELN